jgi:RimJ/RimL family protein N-acetyltransferase
VGEVERELRDGGRVLVRRITPADAPLLADGFARLSEESRRLRFLAPKPSLSEAELRYLSEVDGHRHEALGATDAGTRQGVGIARFVRDDDDPSRAEVAVTVADEWQGRGVGTVLLEHLAERAREEGVARFTALVARDNRPVQGLLERIGPVRVVHHDGATAEYEIELAPRGLGAQLREALRVAAAGELRLPPGLRRALCELVPVRLRDG